MRHPSSVNISSRKPVKYTTVLCWSLALAQERCGLFAAGLGAAKIVVTDGGPPALLELLAYNVQCNADSIERIDASQIEVRSLRWGESSIDEMLGTAFLEEMDWIFASDVTYDDDLHQSLCQTLRDLLLAGPNARAILCEEHGAPTPIAK